MARVRPSLAVIILLILTLDNSRVTHSQHSVNKTFHGSCFPANATVAEINCKKEGGDLFSLVDLKLAYGLVVLESAIPDVGAIWMNGNTDPCQSTTDGASIKTNICCVAVNSNGTNIFQTANCGDQYHYVCNLNTTSTEERNGTHLYIPCLNNIPSTDIAGIIAGTCLTITLVVALITVWCYCSRIRKPKRYAVRVESAIYHRQHPDTDKGGNRAADVTAIDDINTDSAAINQEQRKGANGGDYDTLCRMWSTEDNVVNQRSDVASVYSHLSGIDNLGGWTIENHYDSTAVPMYDRRPVDNLYDRTHVPDI
ncbi:uncharacterized protein LOC124257074 isoform X2 [Haliotis rubra]|uniref:uncharacterized protein LOC124257074 isoform X2 n=1 Tax=Haliotis rubra TaxID=36100 RepID=UPI001EE5AB12|nr:uncharacterized protein LOC124257074 isoform X2 [Haliotis rubra]